MTPFKKLIRTDLEKRTEMEMLSQVCKELSEVCKGLIEYEKSNIQKKSIGEIKRMDKFVKSLEAKARVFRDFSEYYIKLEEEKKHEFCCLDCGKIFPIKEKIAENSTLCENCYDLEMNEREWGYEDA